jgi:hypothetical protein
MKRYYLIFIFTFYGCTSKCDLSNISIRPSANVITSSGERLITFDFTNKTNNNLMIPLAFSIVQNISDNGVVYHLKTIDYVNFEKTAYVPYIYFEQIPDLKQDLPLHKLARNLRDSIAPYIGDRNSFDYIENPALCPAFIFLKSNSIKQLVFKLKQDYEGEFTISFMRKSQSDKIPLWRKWDADMKKMYSNRIEDYQYEYGEFDIDSLEVRN